MYTSMRSRAAAVLFLGMSTLPCPIRAHVWRVTPNGSGDAPTIQAAIDAASAGDSVVLTPGTYSWTAQGGDHVGLPGPSMLNMRSGITLRSESGPNVTILDAEDHGRVIRCESKSNIRVEGLTIQGGNATASGLPGPFSEGGGGGILCRYGSLIVFVNNIICNNRSKFDGAGMKISVSNAQIFSNVVCWNRGQFGVGGIHISGGNAEVRGNTVASNTGGGVGFYQTAVTFSENLILNTVSGWGLWCGDANSTIACNDMWGNPNGNATTCSLGNGNIAEDPLVCATSAEYYLRPDSPCLPENNSCAVLIGARGVGCTATDSETIPGRAMPTLGISPNPSVGQSTIFYSLPRDARSVQLVVYDLRGRVVAQILAGDHLTTGSVIWDGRDGSGTPVSAGVYIVRLQTDRGVSAEKVVITR